QQQQLELGVDQRREQGLRERSGSLRRARSAPLAQSRRHYPGKIGLRCDRTIQGAGRIRVRDRSWACPDPRLPGRGRRRGFQPGPHRRARLRRFVQKAAHGLH
ncbi:unnamed protein product, partial [Linum tenue]